MRVPVVLAENIRASAASPAQRTAEAGPTSAIRYALGKPPRCCTTPAPLQGVTSRTASWHVERRQFARAGGSSSPLRPMRYRLPSTLVHPRSPCRHGLARRCIVLPLLAPCGSEAVLCHDAAWTRVISLRGQPSPARTRNDDFWLIHAWTAVSPSPDAVRSENAFPDATKPLRVGQRQSSIRRVR